MITGRFYIVFQINKSEEILHFKEYRTKVWDQYTSFF